MLLTERLIVNGSELPIAGYTIQAPRDGLAQSVNIALARPDITSIPLDADITFEIGAMVWDESILPDGDFVTSYAPPIIEDGKLNGRNYTVRWVPDERGGYPGDVIEFSAMSPLADRLSLVPTFPIILYDPQLYKPEQLRSDSRNLIREFGPYPDGYRLLTPELEATPDLNLHAVLDRCYKVGCGFTRVITNLPNPRLDGRLDISIEGGYHAAAQPLIAQVSLKPLMFEDNNILYILDPAWGIPSTFPVQQLPLDCVVEVQQSLTPNRIVNAIILSYKENTGIIYAGERPEEKYITEEPQESGEGRKYTREEVVRHVTEYYDINSNELRRVTEHEIVTSIYGFMDDVEVEVTGEGTPEEEVTRTKIEVEEEVLLSQETIENRYVGNTKQGHVRTVDGWFSDPDLRGVARYAPLIRETNEAVWSVDLSHPGENELMGQVTYVEGLCLKETFEDGFTAYTPIQDADEGDLILSDLSQTTEWKPIETIRESLKKTGVNQANVEPKIIDHLKGRTRRTHTVGRPGTRSTYLPNFALPRDRGGYIRERIIDEDSVALYGLRQPITVDAGRLDPLQARILARRKLEYTIEPPKNTVVALPGIGFAIHRGSLLETPLRSGFDGKHIVEGWSITASAIGSDRANRFMRLECAEVKENGA